MIKGSLTLVTHWGHVEVFTSADASAQLLNDSYNIGATSGTGTVYPCGAHEFTPSF
jgi:hypothetical protein